MKQGAQDAYDRFMQTGKIADYLCYLDAKDESKWPKAMGEMGGQGAYLDRGDRSTAKTDG